MKVKKCSQKYYDRLLSKNKVDGDTLYVIKQTYKELEAENKKLQEQLTEANEVVKKYSDGSIYLFPTWYNGSFEANKYLKKWGVE